MLFLFTKTRTWHLYSYQASLEEYIRDKRFMALQPHLLMLLGLGRFKEIHQHLPRARNEEDAEGYVRLMVQLKDELGVPFYESDEYLKVFAKSCSGNVIPMVWC